MLERVPNGGLVMFRRSDRKAIGRGNATPRGLPTPLTRWSPPCQKHDRNPPFNGSQAEAANRLFDVKTS